MDRWTDGWMKTRQGKRIEDAVVKNWAAAKTDHDDDEGNGKELAPGVIACLS